MEKGTMLKRRFVVWRRNWRGRAAARRGGGERREKELAREGDDSERRGKIRNPSTRLSDVVASSPEDDFELLGSFVRFILGRCIFPESSRPTLGLGHYLGLGPWPDEKQGEKLGLIRFWAAQE
ncbi:hypothetical protein Drorol1_Dr00000201 [Drosera rotundifolia]